jgi:hypothetical protein
MAIGQINNMYQTLTKGGSNIFPENLEKQPFWMSFSFYRYSMPSLVQQNVYYRDQGIVRLPLPNNMVDDQHVQYSQESFNLLTGAAINEIQKGNVATGATALGVGAASGLGKDLQNLAESKPATALAQSMGVAINPFLTVMFKQPSFKQHAFEWKLSPSNENESRTLNSIINTFKANMLPDQSGAPGGTLLTYPNILQIAVNVSSANYFTYVFKPAVIESFSVNYTTGGQPSFFGNTKAPTEVTIRLGILEIEYWLSSDYGLNRQFELSGPIGDVLKQFLG